MKYFVLALTLLASAVLADEFQNVDIDWSNVKPIAYYPKFWDNKPAHMRPSPRFFDEYERQRAKNGGLIVGGRPAQPHQFPYQAAVLMFLPDIGGQALCGGSLVGTQTILTAAHCVDGATHGTIVLGAHFLTNQAEPNQRRIAVPGSAVVMHPDWNPLLIRDDVAIVRLGGPAPLIPGVIQAAILPAMSDVNYDFAGEDGVVSGWGVTNSANPVAAEVLHYVYDNILTHAQCSFSIPVIIQPTMICMTGSANRGACNGDSGGPLTVRRGGNSMQVGIVSFGVAIGGCENIFPSVFGRVTSYLPWLYANII
ncbi:hypothetical protein HA402_003620 [Bradysia odoriphaga]|nr:hypothetical protein HA402_003620 [Bradysia odoriphaga]